MQLESNNNNPVLVRERAFITRWCRFAVSLFALFVAFGAQANESDSSSAPQWSAPDERCSVEHEAPQMSLAEFLASSEELASMSMPGSEASPEETEGFVEALAKELAMVGMSCDGYISCSPSLVANAAAMNNVQANPRRSGPLCSADDPRCWLNPEPVCPCAPQLDGPSTPYHLDDAVFPVAVPRVVASRQAPVLHVGVCLHPGSEHLERLERPPRV